MDEIVSSIEVSLLDLGFDCWFQVPFLSPGFDRFSMEWVESAVSLGPKFLDSRAISFSLLSLLEILSFYHNNMPNVLIGFCSLARNHHKLEIGVLRHLSIYFCAPKTPFHLIMMYRTLLISLNRVRSTITVLSTTTVLLLASAVQLLTSSEILWSDSLSVNWQKMWFRVLWSLSIRDKFDLRLVFLCPGIT